MIRAAQGGSDSGEFQPCFGDFFSIISSYDKIGAQKRIEDELKRYAAFSEGVLGKKIAKPKQREVNIRKYAKHILANGTREEKREILEYLKNSVTIKDRTLRI